MKKYILIFFSLILATVFSIIITGNAAAQSEDVSSEALAKLTYPIAELGDCKDREDCKIYCDEPANTSACVSYAEKKNLLSQEDLKVAKKFVAVGGKGPGACNGKNECQAYCEDKAHIDECVSYAEKNGLMSGEELQKAKKVQAAIKKGVKFPGCQNKKECDAYCEDSVHMEECINFAKEAGLLSDEELQKTQKVLTAVKKGVKVPPCKGKDACDTYCAEENHVEECTNFAVETGLVTSEEARIIKETGGKGPGGCKNKSECNSFCGNDANRETCMNFAIEHNIPQPQPPQQPGQGTGSGDQGGPGNNGGNRGQSGWSNGTGNGGGNGGPGGQGSGPNEGQGSNPGSGQGGGQGQGANPNPVKCVEDCEGVGRSCIAAQDRIGEDCASAGQYCRQVTCENLYTDAEGNRPTQEQSHYCNDTICRPTEVSCFDKVVANSSACTTTKDVCVMNCQKASKPAKPVPSIQPPQSGQPTPPIKPSQPGQPSPPAQPSRPPQPGQPTPPIQPTPPAGYCGDGKCGRMEQANPSLCPQDCGG